MKQVKEIKLKKIKQGFYGDGNEYRLGETTFLISRSESFRVYDKSIGINDGNEIFRIYGRIDFNYAMRQFKNWLQTSNYNKP